MHYHNSLRFGPFGPGRMIHNMPPEAKAAFEGAFKRLQKKATPAAKAPQKQSQLSLVEAKSWLIKAQVRQQARKRKGSA